MGKLSHSFRESVKAQLDRTSLVPSDWICQNFKNPKDDRKPWSFKDHEFQIDIANVPDKVKHSATIKCAQVGLSTLQIRSNLCFAATHDFLKLAYVLPTAGFAREFTQSRFDPAVESSSTVSALMSKDIDNTGLKKIGSCFLLMRGTSGTTAAISFDLDLITTDEIDFCNQTVLKAFSSRLQHSDLGLRRDFSTPTLPGYGVSALYNDSSRGVRFVKHDVCGQWVMLSFFEDVVIPGLDKPIIDYRTEDCQTSFGTFHPGLDKAWYKCPHCHKPISEGNLAEPTEREWVHAHPDHWRMGFAVSPWDVPKYNPLSTVLKSIKDYTYQDFVNFRIGLPYESSENSFLSVVIDRMSVMFTTPLSEMLRGGVYGTYIGVDLGKVSHVVVGMENSDLGTLDIIYAAQVKVSDLGEMHLGKWLEKLANATNCYRMVIDAMPDYSVAMYCAEKGVGYGAEYRPNPSLDIYGWDDNKGKVNIDRDLHFDDLASMVNSGRIRFPKPVDVFEGKVNLMKDHLGVMKKAQVQTSSGLESKWVSITKNDHYAHALGYMFAAWASLRAREGKSLLSVLPAIGLIQLKT